jgi:hypothetical protein
VVNFITRLDHDRSGNLTLGWRLRSKAALL